MRAQSTIIGIAAWLVCTAIGGARSCNGGFLAAADAPQSLNVCSGPTGSSSETENGVAAPDAVEVELTEVAHFSPLNGSGSSSSNSSLVRTTSSTSFAALPELVVSP